MPYRKTQRSGGKDMFLSVHNKGFEEKPLFRTSADYKHFLSLLPRLGKANDSLSIIGYSLMQDSFHLVVHEKERGEVPKFMHKLAISYSVYFNSRYKTKGKVFTGPYKDHALTTDDELVLELCRIHMQSLVIGEKPESYEWSSYQKYIKNQAPWLDKTRIVAYFKTHNFVAELVRFTNSVASKS